jgi:hypothetical protein
MMGTYCALASSVTLITAILGFGLLSEVERELVALRRLMSSVRRGDVVSVCLGLIQQQDSRHRAIESAPTRPTVPANINPVSAPSPRPYSRPRLTVPFLVRQLRHHLSDALRYPLIHHAKLLIRIAIPERRRRRRRRSELRREHLPTVFEAESVSQAQSRPPPRSCS